MTRNPPHREPGRRGPPPEGAYRRQKKAKTPARPSRARAQRAPEDPVIAHHAADYEDADYLQRQALGAALTSQALTGGSFFGVSGWIVSAMEFPLPEGYALLSTIQAAGFGVVKTPELGRPGHVTILLTDPVDEEQARRFNAAFGRFQED